MNTFRRAVLVAMTLLSASLIQAAEKAAISQNRANVRGQASLFGEVITQLKKGDEVQILEEITLPKPKAGEPAKWFKIVMPENTPVWVFSSYVDATKTVTVKKLNLRAGPGENYSPVGRLEKGDKVKEIRVVEDWMEIETPPQAYAFISADLVGKGEPQLAAATPKEETPKPAAIQPEVPAPAPVAAPVVIPPPPVKEVVSDATVTPARDLTPAIPTPATAAEVPKSEPVPQPKTEVVKTEQPKPAEKLPEVAPEAASKALPEVAPKRVVRREGIVRSTPSIQAPTYYELINADTRKTINYIHTGKSGINLKQYKGKKIVISGEEMIDSRWPNVPVIEVETLIYNPELDG